MAKLFQFPHYYDRFQSGSERTAESETSVPEDRDYKALYEASCGEVRRLRELLATSEQQLRDARSTITMLTQVVSNIHTSMFCCSRIENNI